MSPLGNVQYGFVATAGSSALAMRFNYFSTDGKGYDDHAWARVVDASSSNASTGKVVPGDVVHRSQFEPDKRLVGFDSFRFNTPAIDDPINWSALGDSNRSCWRDNAQRRGFTGRAQPRYSFASPGS